MSVSVSSLLSFLDRINDRIEAEMTRNEIERFERALIDAENSKFLRSKGSDRQLVALHMAAMDVKPSLSPLFCASRASLDTLDDETVSRLDARIQNSAATGLAALGVMIEACGTLLSPHDLAQTA